MLKYIHGYLKNKRNSKIKLTRYNNYITKLRASMFAYINRTYNSQLVMSTHGTQLLNQILNKVDLTPVLKLGNYIDRSFYIRNYFLENYNSYFISNSTKQVTYGTFIKKGIFNTSEILIPTVGFSNIVNYSIFDTIPKSVIQSEENDNTDFNDINIRSRFNKFFDQLLNVENEDKLYKIRPLRMISADSTEISMNMKDGYLNFFTNPSTCTYALHIERFLIGYTYYLTTTPGNDKDKSIYNYLWRWCIIPLMLDTADMYILNILKRLIILIHQKGDVLRKKDVDIEMFLRGGNSKGGNEFVEGYANIERGVNDLVSLTNKVRRMKITPEEYLSNIVLPSGSSLIGYINYLYEDVELIDNLNNRWMIWLRDKYSIELILLLYRLVPNYENSRIIENRLVSAIKSYDSGRFYGKVKDLGLRSQIKIDFSKMKNELNFR